jgi:hypothetical protein
VENPFSKYRKGESAKSAETLFRVMEDGAMKVVGIDDIKGDKGDRGDSIKGDRGDDGRGIKRLLLKAKNLIVSYTDGTAENIGVIVGNDGKDGISIIDASQNTKGELVITYSNGVDKNVGLVRGKDGDDGKPKDGKDGRGIKNCEINDDGEFCIYYTDDTEENHGKIKEDRQPNIVNGMSSFGVGVKNNGSLVGMGFTNINFTGSGINSITKTGREVTVDVSGGGGGATAFIDLTDVPSSYAGQSGKVAAVNGTEDGLEFIAVGGTGTVTSVSVTTANGVSGSVATATTTPAITLTLGAITPTSVAASGTVTGSNLSNTNTGDQTSIVGISGTKAQFDTAVTDGDFLYVGDITQYTDELAQDAVGAMVDASLVYVDGTPSLGVAANVKKTTIGFTVDGGGSAITTGKVKGFFTCPYAGTISGYNIVADAGTCTVKTWKIATGTAKPTVAHSISTSGVSLSSGTAIHSATVTDFTTTTVTANDIFAFDITAVATATELSYNIEITRT